MSRSNSIPRTSLRAAARVLATSLSLSLLAGPFVPGVARADHPAVGLGSGLAGPVVTIPAHTLAKGTWGWSVRLERIELDPFTDAELAALAAGGAEPHSTDDVASPSLAVAYGLTNALTVSARLPYVARGDIREGHDHGAGPEIHAHGDSRGLGDLTLLSQLKLAEHGRSTFAMILGVKVPTGATDVAGDDDSAFEADHQPGSGSWDLLQGFAWSRALGFGSLDASVLAAFGTEGTDDTNLGTGVAYNVAVSGRVAGGVGHAGEPSGHHHDDAADHEHGAAAHGSRGIAADIILELNGEARSPVTVAGDEEENTGGNLIYVSPGFRFGRPGAWNASFSMGFPFVQDLNGTQHETEWRILTGVGFAFR